MLGLFAYIESGAALFRRHTAIFEDLTGRWSKKRGTKTRLLRIRLECS